MKEGPACRSCGLNRGRLAVCHNSRAGAGRRSENSGHCTPPGKGALRSSSQGTVQGQEGPSMIPEGLMDNNQLRGD